MLNYSIIIPHKNIPSLLRRCLESIPNCPDIEIIIVDDNSDEETIKCLKEIHRNNLRIIYTKEGKGAGYARNIGVKNAHGKWILFADADDLFLPNLLEKIDKYKDSTKALVFFNSICRNSSDLGKIGNRQWLCNLFSNNIEKFRLGKISTINLILGLGVPWAKMIQLNFLLQKNITFDEVLFANDIGWITQIALNVNEKDFIIANEQIYCVTDRDNSLFHTYTLESLLCRFNAAYKQHVTLKKNGIASSFDYIPYITWAQKLGITAALRFYKHVLQSVRHNCGIYKIETKYHFNKSYLYSLIQTIKIIISLPVSFFKQMRNSRL